VNAPTLELVLVGGILLFNLGLVLREHRLTRGVPRSRPHGYEAAEECGR
jgi:hypothetical protein